MSDFNLWDCMAERLDRWAAWMNRPEVVIYAKTSLGCPAQWEALLNDGRIVMIHVRRGYFKVEDTERGTVICDLGLDDGELSTLEIADGGGRGKMDFDEMRALTDHLFDWQRADRVDCVTWYSWKYDEGERNE